MAWPVITPGVTEATKQFFEEIKAWVIEQSGLGEAEAAKTEAEAAKTKAEEAKAAAEAVTPGAWDTSLEEVNAKLEDDSSAYTPAVALVNESTAELSGGWLVKTGDTLEYGEKVAKLPSAYRPKKAVLLTSASNASRQTIILLEINTSGEIIFVRTGNNVSAGQVLSLDGLRFRLK